MARFIDPQMLLTLLSAIAAFATVMAIALPFLRRDERGARLKAISRRREELSRQQRERIDTQRGAPLREKKKSVALMRGILEKVKLEDLAASQELRQRLKAAGYRSPGAPVVFLFVRLGTTVGFVLVALAFFLLAKEALPLVHKVAVIAGALLGGFYLPAILVKNQAQKRQEEITLVFPDTLDLLVICTESGLSIEAAFVRVTEEIGESSAVMAEEMGLTSAELAFLGDRRKAYANLADRTGVQAARSLATTLIQSEKYGTPVSQALRVLSDENRSDRMAKAEKKAGALPAQLTVPMIVFFLPALFVAIIGPAIIQIMRM
ncbi:type II secretion system F family protein [Novispirillum sp. DQ9]|uniref:type II secretion system F family protein n=1 Tax=Novispirillum sp. DQ9 TaxID=3398612 RepID=UPI003C7BDEB7